MNLDTESACLEFGIRAFTLMGRHALISGRVLALNDLAARTRSCKFARWCATRPRSTAWTGATRSSSPSSSVRRLKLNQ
jgi:hypothetical protein